MWCKWCQQLDKALGMFDVELVFLIGVIYKNHELGNGRVEFQSFDVFAHRLDGFMINLVQVAIVFADNAFVEIKR